MFNKQLFCLFLDIVIFFTFSLQCKILCANKIFRTDIECLPHHISHQNHSLRPKFSYNNFGGFGEREGCCAP